MNVLDVVLLVAAVWFAIVGYRQGFVVGVLSVVGFLGGGLAALYLLPLVWRPLTGDAGVSTTAAIVAVAVVLVLASVGQTLTTHLGNRLRRHITWSPARALDATGGALINVVAMLLVAWLIGTFLAQTALPLGKKARESRVFLGVSRVMPDQAPKLFDDFRSVLADNGLPQVFSPFANEPIQEVRPPDPALVGSPVAARAQRSIVKVVGTAGGCGKVMEGTGFVFGERRVMTNAHVVGGVDEPTVQIGGQGRLYDATVVLYDWQRDIAVLDVPDLEARPLRFAETDARSGDSAIVAGFPENGAYDVRSARVRDRIDAEGPDIYHRGEVRRDMYSLYATIRPGNSGGPLLTADGEVYGVIFARSLDDASTGYALTVDEIREDIALGLSSGQQVDSQGCAL
ncbi:MarP family serine protease [Streptomyces somaliensis]|uniref:MarP family serine protease n=1 Tax=Streptomyces somaliensis TaxID=78355 RepID=UPI0020CD983E|nr:MarP family serine protease [Streptomyces somaliensis]MCP9945225.1 MarP family serine protease [Streptomyces somaliensis]MCP9961564.1 MarP family serine protease [Streptomyces somaliensis]MCP9974378.1 MarP family serine protease [Streptomyces somaliensis]